MLPGGGYFGTKKACEPLHGAQYAHNDHSVWVVNSLYQAFPGMKVHAAVYNLDMTEKFAKDVPLDIGADSSTRAIEIPKIDDLSPTFFVRLELRDATNKLVSTNFYWLSTTEETLDWTKTNYYVTPVLQHANLQALNTLPAVKLVGSSKAMRNGATESIEVTLSNPSKALAFAVSLRLTDARGDDVLPVFFEDNYFSLMPGEKRTVDIQYSPEDGHVGSALVHVDGWNVEAVTLHSAVAGQGKPAAKSAAN